MPRPNRSCPAGVVFHVLNRANGRLPLFEADRDYEAFEAVLEQAQERTNARLVAYVVMPNHWHLVVWPQRDEEVSAFVGWLTLTHSRRWQTLRNAVGEGHVYQGRFKSFPVQDDGHFLRLCRFVERHPLRAGLVTRAEDWRWSSLWRRTHGDAAAQALLSDWPLAGPQDWVDVVNDPEDDPEAEVLHRCLKRGQPFGDPAWVGAIAARLGLTSTLRPPGRPRQLPE